ncbi:MAG: HlyD family efflux transporter periplasmic adaptor subunit [Granulosicoccus sp.]
MPATDHHDNFDSARASDSVFHGVVSSNSSSASVDTRSLIRATRAEFIANRQAMVLAIMAELLGPPDLERALDAFVGALQQRLGAQRVSLGLVEDDGSLKLGAISQQARIDMASNEVRLLLDVMDECLEHECVVCYPVRQTGLGSLPAHQALGTRREHTNLASLPLYRNLEPVGVLLLERHRADPFLPSTLVLLENIATKAGLVLSLRCEADRRAFSRARITCENTLNRFFGSARAGKRFLFALSLCLTAFAAVAPLPELVSARAELVPSERRLVTAPFDGFVESVAIKPGESVESGQLLAQLETRELELEGIRRDGEIGSVESQFRSAMATRDRQATAVARARLARERALRALIDQRLGRVELLAPIGGLIVSGDPADAVGAPVTRGDTLFEISRADDYEVHLMVHERDIHNVHEGQSGKLYLRARPSEELDLRVHAIHPVAESMNGASRFRVRATLILPDGVKPRPGESGIGRLIVGKTSILHMLGEPLVRGVSQLWWRISR